MTTLDADLSVTSTFESTNPASGDVIGTFPVHSPDDVRAAVERARTAAAWWGGLDFDARKRRLLGFKALLAKRQDDLCQLISRETGKPVDDARIELVLAIDHLDWAAKHAEKVLGPRRVPSTLLYANHRAMLEYEPAGVVGVIGPWNYPLHTPLGSITYALAAGNTVVYKPSEYTPAVGQWLVRTFGDVVGEHPVLQLVTGFGETGSALCRAGVDVLAFTGSASTGRKVMAACAETLTKVVMECGGKDAMIVTADADLDAAAAGAVWASCANAGQTCAGVERVYVEAPVYDAFVDKVVTAARALRAGTDDAFGPMTMPSQIDVIRRHLDEALQRGARAIVGGPESIDPPYVHPVVLVDVPEDTAVMREETFGPLLPIVKVADVDEAVARTNDSDYGLGASVYASEGGEAIARRLRVGMVAVNSVISFAALPALPFGGRGESGFGRIHGEDGLREFTQPRAITVKRFSAPIDVARFDRQSWAMTQIGRVVKLLHGRGA